MTKRTLSWKRLPQNILKPFSCPLEHDEQAVLIRAYRLQFPRLAKYLIAIPNGGKRDVVVARRLQDEGVISGVPDLFLAWPSKGFHGLWIELKRKDKSLSKVSAAQKEMITALNDAGYKAIVCFGAEMALEAIKDYLQEE